MKYNPRYKKPRKKEKAFLVGPFIGELSWEFFRFSPYVTYLKKEHSNIKIIVFTRADRFDLYGTYVDILVPLKLVNCKNKHQNGFTINGFSHDNYDMLVKLFKQQYKERYKIVDHIYPNITKHYYKLKWQFSRTLMDYSFSPRAKNREVAHTFMKPGQYIFAGVEDHKNFASYEVKHSNVFSNEVKNFIDDKCTELGCMIEAIKISKAVVGNMDSDVCRLALLLKKPVIVVEEKMSEDSINLLNPFKIPVIKAPTVKDGVDLYENNF